MGVKQTLRCCLAMVLMTLVQTKNIQVEYFTSAVLSCDDKSLNISGSIAKHSNIRGKYWIIPSGAKLDNSSIPEIVKRQKEWEISNDWYNFNITINYVDDDDFGVYYCVLVRDDFRIDIVKQGLNEDGPYYGNLNEEYRHNAMVGGIAAAILFVLILGSCIFWHCRYAKNERDLHDMEELKDESDDKRGFDNDVVNNDEMSEKL